MKSIDIRIAKKDAAFVYAILESWEGLAAYGTLAPFAEDSISTCRLRLWSDPQRTEELQERLVALADDAPLEIVG